MDPTGDNMGIYNRYANVLFLIGKPQSIVKWSLPSPDAFIVEIPIDHVFFREVGVRYILVQDSSDEKSQILKSGGYVRVSQNSFGAIWVAPFNQTR